LKRIETVLLPKGKQIRNNLTGTDVPAEELGTQACKSSWMVRWRQYTAQSWLRQSFKYCAQIEGGSASD
jgi:hypothetical protein